MLPGSADRCLHCRCGFGDSREVPCPLHADRLRLRHRACPPCYGVHGRFAVRSGGGGLLEHPSPRRAFRLLVLVHGVCLLHAGSRPLAAACAFGHVLDGSLGSRLAYRGRHRARLLYDRQVPYSAAARESVLSLLCGGLAPVFWAGVVLCGLLIPVAACSIRLRAVSSPPARIVVSSCALIGGFALRYAIVSAACYTAIVAPIL